MDGNGLLKAYALLIEDKLEHLGALGIMGERTPLGIMGESPRPQDDQPPYKMISYFTQKWNCRFRNREKFKATRVWDRVAD